MIETGGNVDFHFLSVVFSSIGETRLTETSTAGGAIYDLFQDAAHIVLCSM